MAIAYEKYNISLRIIHWVMALTIIAMIGVGWYMTELPKEGSLKNVLIGLHKSFGALLLILFFVRIALRFTTKIPALPVGIPKIQKKLAHLGHFMLYVFMLIVPLSGYAMSNLYGYDVSMFGIPLPKLFAENKDLGKLAREAHGIIPYVLLAIVVLHVAAVIQHHFLDKKENDVLKRMV
jgi:cytochrome b561